MSLEKLAEIKELITKLEFDIDAFVSSEPSMDEACSALVEMNILKRDVSYMYDHLSRAVSRIMGETENISLPDGSTIEKKSSYDRKGWDHKALASVVAQKVVQMSVDMDTGEVIKSPQEIAAEMLTYCAPSYWRIKELNKLGVNADNYCEVGELRTSIIVRKPKEI
jgi:hypothetical protein